MKNADIPLSRYALLADVFTLKMIPFSHCICHRIRASSPNLRHLIYFIVHPSLIFGGCEAPDLLPPSSQWYSMALDLNLNNLSIQHLLREYHEAIELRGLRS